MSLAQVRDKIKQVLPMALQDADSGPYETLAGRRGQKRQAEEKLKQLKSEYTQLLLRSAIFIVTTGTGASEFAALASSEAGNCFAADSEKFYTDIVNSVNPALYLRESLPNLFGVVSRALETKMMGISLIQNSYPSLNYKETYARAVKNKEDLLAVLKVALTEQVGGEMVGIQAIHDLVDEAIQKNHGASLTPIVLKTTDEVLALKLLPALERLTPRVFLVGVGKTSKAVKAVEGAIFVKEASAETVESALTTVRSNLKK